MYYHSRQKELCQLLERKPPTSIADEPIEPQPLNPLWLIAVRAAEDKKAANIKVLDVSPLAVLGGLLVTVAAVLVELARQLVIPSN